MGLLRLREVVVGQEWTFDTDAKIVNNWVDPTLLVEQVSLSKTIL